jgi:dTDP-4-amino-4,6-dideoxygalactose transaminase
MSASGKLALAKPWLGQEEIAGARAAIESGWVTQGPRVDAFEKDFAARTGSPYACAVSSGTTALHLALLTAGVLPGDVVVTVSHSFIATANAVRYCLAEPWFLDIETGTLNLSVDELRRSLVEDFEPGLGGLFLKPGLADRLQNCPESPLRLLRGRLGRLGAVLVVHQVGLPADMAGVLALTEPLGVPVVEDAACALGSEVSLDGGASFQRIGRPHGRSACFSFHPRKVVTTGDGGMITTADAAADVRCRLLRQHGMSKSAAEREGAKKVVFEQYVSTGFNYRMTDIQAGVGLAQLARLDELVADRRRQADHYAELLRGLPQVRVPAEPAYARTNWQSYAIRLDDAVDRDAVMQRMQELGVPTRRGIMNAHREPPYSAAWSEGCLPRSEAAQDHCLILPMHHELTEADRVFVVRSLKEALA